MNPRINLYLIVNQVDSYHDCVRGPLIGDTKDIFWIDDLLLIMTYKSLVMRSLVIYNSCIPIDTIQLLLIIR